MLLDRKKYNEFGFINEDLLGDADKELLHKCMVVEQSIADGDFLFDEALEAYQLSKEDYENYIAKRMTAEMFLSILGNKKSDPYFTLPFTLSIVSEIFSRMVETSYNEHLLSHIVFDKRLNLITIDKFVGEIKKSLDSIPRDPNYSKEKA